MSTEAEAERACREAERQFREEKKRDKRAIAAVERPFKEAMRTLRSWDKATPGTSGRPRPVNSPNVGSGRPPQPFPTPSNEKLAAEKLQIVLAWAFAVGRRFQRDQNELASDVTVQTADLATREKMPWDRAFEQVARQIESDLASGRR